MSVKKETAGFCSRSAGQLLEAAISVYCPRPSDSPVDTPKFRSLALKMLGDFTRAYPTAPESVKVLSAGMRSVVLALTLSDGQQVVLKHYRRRDSASNSGGFGYLREKHGLVSLSSLVPGSYARLIFADDSARLLCTEYVPGTALASFLLEEQDEGSPESALDAWLDFWAAQLNSPAQGFASDSGLLTTYSARIASADPRAPRPGFLPSPQLALKGLEKICAAEGIELGSPEHGQRVKAVDSILSPAQEDCVLSSGDFSPHNLLLATGASLMSGAGSLRVRGIDAEGSAIHHRYLPVAELLLGFPSAPSYPTYQRFVSKQVWLAKTQEFYERVVSNPQANLLEDCTLLAAVLTLQAILTEQTGACPSPVCWPLIRAGTAD